MSLVKLGIWAVGIKTTRASALTTRSVVTMGKQPGDKLYDDALEVLQELTIMQNFDHKLIGVTAKLGMAICEYGLAMVNASEDVITQAEDILDEQF